MARFSQVLALALAGLLAVLYGAGFIDAPVAFVQALALAGVYTLHQLLSRLDQPLGEAAAAVLAEPESRAHPWTYWIYLATLAVTAAVAAEALLR
jgi:hypothetical protein